eukprot:2600881-Heterocapsa_arctica.AAC.1
MTIDKYKILLRNAQRMSRRICLAAAMPAAEDPVEIIDLEGDIVRLDTFFTGGHFSPNGHC